MNGPYKATNLFFLFLLDNHVVANGSQRNMCRQGSKKHKNEDSHAHSIFDALVISVFPGNHRHFELHWANRKSKGSGDRRGGDHLALKPDARITKDCYELGYVELKPPPGGS